jgi:hypothetical protein
MLSMLAVGVAEESEKRMCRGVNCADELSASCAASSTLVKADVVVESLLADSLADSFR